MWSTGISCGQQVPNMIRIHLFYVIVDAIGSFHHLLTVQTHVHAYFHVFLLILSYVTSTSEMALIGSVNPSHGTAACLHYTWNDICVQMIQVYHFTVVASV